MDGYKLYELGQLHTTQIESLNQEFRDKVAQFLMHERKFNRVQYFSFGERNLYIITMEVDDKQVQKLIKVVTFKKTHLPPDVDKTWRKAR